MDPVVLRTARLELHCVTTADASAIVEACRDPLIPRYTHVPSPYSVEDAHNFIARSAEAWAQGTDFVFGFYLTTTGELVGTCGLKRAPEGRLEVGYWTNAAFRGRGLTTEAVSRVCRWGFDELGIDQIGWCAIVGNEASRAVALRAGFELAGTRAEATPSGGRRELWFGTLRARPI